MRKGIIIGIGVLLILLALAGTVSAKPAWGATCDSGSCHNSGGFNGTVYANVHKFNGISAPTVTVSCGNCHIQPPSGSATPYDMNLTSNGSSYNNTHRYNDTTLASEKLTAPACGNCHNDTINNSFSLISGAGTSLSNNTCVYCHTKLVDDWSLSNHSSPYNVSKPIVTCVTCHLEHNATRGIETVATINTSCLAIGCHRSTSNPVTKHGSNGYKITQCKYCHMPKVLTVNTTYDTASHTWDWTTQLLSSPGDERHEAVFGELKNVTKNDTLTKASCDMCHGYDFAGKVRYSYQGSAHYNVSANNVTANGATPYCTDCHLTANTTEVINNATTCSNCHSTLVHVNSSKIVGIECVNCHFNSSNVTRSHNLTVATVSDYNYTCTLCHTANSNRSIIPEINEWDNSGHNGTTENSSSCIACHGPMADDKGITCSVCHNIHNMTEWLNRTKVAFGVEKSYGWYNASAVGKYTMVANTTELCVKCHLNRDSVSYTVPGWGNSRGPEGARVPHYSNQKDVFLGSVKQSSFNFECTDCHMYFNTTYGTGSMDDSNKSTGHTFAVNRTALQNKSECNYCHVNGTKGVDTIPNVIAKIKNDTQAKWNLTNDTIEGAYSYVNTSSGTKNLSMDKLAQAFFKLYQVKRDGSWGVHNPAETNQLLDEAAALAIAANASLGLGSTSNIDLVAGWNLVALNGTPSVNTSLSVLSSVSSNITVVWGYNATSRAWLLYDPVMPAALDTLTTMVPGKGYWINAIRACKWTA